MSPEAIAEIREVLAFMKPAAVYLFGSTAVGVRGRIAIWIWPFFRWEMSLFPSCLKRDFNWPKRSAVRWI